MIKNILKMRGESWQERKKVPKRRSLLNALYVIEEITPPQRIERILLINYSL